LSPAVLHQSEHPPPDNPLPRTGSNKRITLFGTKLRSINFLLKLMSSYRKRCKGTSGHRQLKEGRSYVWEKVKSSLCSSFIPMIFQSRVSSGRSDSCTLSQSDAVICVKFCLIDWCGKLSYMTATHQFHPFVTLLCKSITGFLDFFHRLVL
jgi:hypothetical protein